ncbi:MAG: LexA family transcriptional regulator [Rhodobacteraceae bacterium]|uniref:LexA family transcriptional regulator n=1 Tax=Salipiger thiooxidans TaxID=282683 RepID=UPI001A8D1F08|nr:LexA family transcriptional regulator [Salipiger thiooxidans]MBN8190320.1 LexA family transcriptional regulator [Salipiger thiooxidans]MBR9841260.1 LexA family transcriptional regulator [Paracoccaceae bacterium]
MDEIIAEIEAALGRKGMSASAASRMAVNNPSLIKNLIHRRAAKGQPHPIENLKALAEVLGLEFYFGPPREPSSSVEFDHERFALIPHYSPALISDEGYLDLSAEPDEHMAFPWEWLTRHHIQTQHCVLITAIGNSMAPTIYDGDLVMINRRKRKPFPGRVFAFHSIEDGTLIRRFELIPGSGLLARCDNPDQKMFPPLLYTELEKLESRILGEVTWTGHTW